MAKTPVTLIVKDCDEREVLAVDYEFDQEIGRDGQMVGIPRGGKVHVITKALNTGKSDLTAWMLDPTGARDVNIIFMDTVQGKKMKEYVINGAYCVDYTEKWVEGEGHVEDFIMTCQKIDFNGVVFENQWA